MAVVMSKELLIRLPEPLYQSLMKMCASEYKSMFALVRELLSKRMEATLSQEDWKDIKDVRSQFKAGKTVSWRSIKRG